MRSGSTEPTQSEEVEGTREDGEKHREKKKSQAHLKEPKRRSLIRESLLKKQKHLLMKPEKKNLPVKQKRLLKKASRIMRMRMSLMRKMNLKRKVTEEDEIVDEDGSASEEEGEDSGGKKSGRGTC